MFSMTKNKWLWLIVLVTLVVFSNTVKNRFVWDDHAFVENQQQSGAIALKGAWVGTFPVSGSNTYRPIRNTVYALTIPFFKNDPKGYHSFILGMHLLIVVMVCQLLYILTKNQTTSMVGTLLFALHPIHAENIYWITAGYDLVFVLLYLLTIITHIRFFHEGKGAKWVSFALAFAAIFSNEIALTVPLIIMSIDGFWYKVAVFKKPTSSVYLSYFVIAFFFLVIRSFFVNDQALNSRVYENYLEEIQLSGMLFGNYLQQLVVPNELTVDHQFQQGLTGLYSQNHNLSMTAPKLDVAQKKIINSIIYTGIWLCATLILIIKKKRGAVVFLWIPLTLLAVLRVVPLPILYAERYAYLASIGFTLGIVHSINSVKAYKYVYRGSICAVLIASIWFAKLSHEAGEKWHSDVNLWSNAFALNNESAAAASALGVHYFLEGNVDTSFYFHEMAIQANPYMSSYQSNYISGLVRQKRYQELVVFIEKILKTDPNNVSLHTLLASSFDELGNYKQAMSHYQKAYDLLPNSSSSRLEIEQLVTILDKKYHIVDLE